MSDHSFLRCHPEPSCDNSMSLPQCLGPGAKRWLMDSAATAINPAAMTLFEQDHPEPLIKFVLDLEGTRGPRPQFSPDGLHLVWGNPSGGVTVVDLVEVNRRLSELAWGGEGIAQMKAMSDILGMKKEHPLYSQP